VIDIMDSGYVGMIKQQKDTVAKFVLLVASTAVAEISVLLLHASFLSNVFFVVSFETKC
jgi:hypothetical protein